MAPEGSAVRFAGRDVLALPGSRSALRRTVPYPLPGGVTVRIPDVESALSLKGAAYQTTSPNTVRHLQDGVTLFACANPEGLNISKSMRANINMLINALTNIEAWAYADPLTRRRALRTIRAMRSEWPIPSYVLPRRP